MSTRHQDKAITSPSSSRELQEMREKYSRLKRKYFTIEERYKEISIELQRSGERNEKARYERDVLLDRIMELEHALQYPRQQQQQSHQPYPPINSPEAVTRRSPPIQNPVDSGNRLHQDAYNRDRDRDEEQSPQTDAGRHAPRRLNSFSEDEEGHQKPPMKRSRRSYTYANNGMSSGSAGHPHARQLSYPGYYPPGERSHYPPPQYHQYPPPQPNAYYHSSGSYGPRSRSPSPRHHYDDYSHPPPPPPTTVQPYYYFPPAHAHAPAPAPAPAPHSPQPQSNVSPTVPPASYPHFLPSTPSGSAQPSSLQKLAKPKRLKAHTVKTKSHTVPPVPRDPHNPHLPLLPLNVGIMTLISLGQICTREHFHTERYIFPIGYSVARRFLSTINPNADVIYTCTILDGGGPGSNAGPQFQIIPSDVPDRPVVAGTATGAWSNIVKAANTIRKRQHSNSVSGPDFFGLSQTTIKYLIQELPDADTLRDYVWQHYIEGGDPNSSRNRQIGRQPLVEGSQRRVGRNVREDPPQPPPQSFRDYRSPSHEDPDEQEDDKPRLQGPGTYQHPHSLGPILPKSSSGTSLHASAESAVRTEAYHLPLIKSPPSPDTSNRTPTTSESENGSEKDSHVDVGDHISPATSGASSAIPEKSTQSIGSNLASIMNTE